MIFRGEFDNRKSIFDNKLYFILVITSYDDFSESEEHVPLVRVIVGSKSDKAQGDKSGDRVKGIWHAATP